MVQVFKGAAWPNPLRPRDARELEESPQWEGQRQETLKVVQKFYFDFVNILFNKGVIYFNI